MFFSVWLTMSEFKLLAEFYSTVHHLHQQGLKTQKRVGLCNGNVVFVPELLVFPQHNNADSWVMKLFYETWLIQSWNPWMFCWGNDYIVWMWNEYTILRLCVEPESQSHMHIITFLMKTLNDDCFLFALFFRYWISSAIRDRNCDGKLLMRQSNNK